MFDTNTCHWFLIDFFLCIDAEMLSDSFELLSIFTFSISVVLLLIIVNRWRNFQFLIFNFQLFLLTLQPKNIA